MRNIRWLGYAAHKSAVCCFYLYLPNLPTCEKQNGCISMQQKAERVLGSSLVFQIKDRLHQVLDCDQTVQFKLVDGLFQPCPKNSRNHIQENLCYNICLIVPVLRFHSSYSAVSIHINCISTKSQSHFCGWETWSSAMERLVELHSEQEVQAGSSPLFWH